MPKQLNIPDELLVLNPDLNRKELKAIINIIWKSKSNKLRQSKVFYIKLPHIGVIRSHGNKIHKHSKKTLIRDKKRKKKEYLIKQLKREKLLY